MPCYRCGARQTDPARGPSPWKRAVRSDVQVLVCPDCQRTHDWEGDMDRCASCGSTQLLRLLGETQCRACGAVGGVAAVARHSSHPVGPVGRTGSGGLADEVGAALDRLFGRA